MPVTFWLRCLSWQATVLANDVRRCCVGKQTQCWRVEHIFLWSFELKSTPTALCSWCLTVLFCLLALEIPSLDHLLASQNRSELRTLRCCVPIPYTYRTIRCCYSPTTAARYCYEGLWLRLHSAVTTAVDLPASVGLDNSHCTSPLYML